MVGMLGGTQFLDLIVERYNESRHSGLGGKCLKDVYHGNVVFVSWVF